MIVGEIEIAPRGRIPSLLRTARTLFSLSAQFLIHERLTITRTVTVGIVRRICVMDFISITISCFTMMIIIGDQFLSFYLLI